MRISIFTAYFCTGYTEFSIYLFCDKMRINWSIKTWPTCSRVKFVSRAKQWFSCDDIYINPRLVIIPICILKRWFGSFFLCDIALFFCESITNNRIIWSVVFFCKFCIFFCNNFLFFFCPIFMNKIFSS